LQGDLGGNLDNDHSQTSYFGTMVVILYAGAVQIKAVARALNAEIIACRGIFNTMGFRDWTEDETC
jgi:hypothetical protein